MSRVRRGRRGGRFARPTARMAALPALLAVVGALAAGMPESASANTVRVGAGVLRPTSACGAVVPPRWGPSGSPTATGTAGPATPSNSATATATGPAASASMSASGSASAPVLATALASASTAAAALTGTCRPAGTRSGKPSVSPTDATPTPTHRPPSPVSRTTPTAPSLLTDPAGLGPYPPVTRAGILRRAIAWVDEQVPYSETAWWPDAEGTYRQDCSGFVSMAWGLDQNIDYWTGNLDTVSFEIPAWDLLPGDILLSATHTVLFAGWADAAHTEFDFYEESHPGTVAHYVHGAPLSAYVDGGFAAYRFDDVVGAAGDLPAPPRFVEFSDLGSLTQALDPEGADPGRPPMAPWQTLPDSGAGPDGQALTGARPGSAQPRITDAQPAADAVAESGAGSIGVAFGGTLVLFAGTGVVLVRRRTVRVAGVARGIRVARAKRRH